MNNSQVTPQQPGFFSRLLRFLNRLLLAVLLGGLLGAALFYGVPALYRQFIQPVQDHTLQIQDLQARQDNIETQVGERIATLTARLETVELQSDANKAAISELETLQMLQSTSQARLDILQTSAANQQSSLSTLEVNLQSVQNSTDSTLTAINLSLDSLDQRIADLESAQSVNVSVSEMRQQIQILRAMQLLLRTEFYLSQDNYGLAVQDIQTAIDVVRDLSTSLSADEVETAIEVVGYLESALSDLPALPVIASNKLSTSWQILLIYLQKPVATPTPTPTASSNAGSTPTNTPVPAGTLPPTITPKP
jgi:DNA-binding Lrp family transcriptional regulator